MAFINWNKELSVGITSIDEEHKKLIEMINDFYDNIKNRTNKENISLLIKGMKNYAEFHFKEEESYMTQFYYPEYEAHKIEHEAFIAKVTEVETKFNSGKMVISFEITRFLKDWLKEHIQGTDKKYTDFFIGKGIK